MKSPLTDLIGITTERAAETAVDSVTVEVADAEPMELAEAFVVAAIVAVTEPIRQAASDRDPSRGHLVWLVVVGGEDGTDCRGRPGYVGTAGVVHVALAAAFNDVTEGRTTDLLAAPHIVGVRFLSATAPIGSWVVTCAPARRGSM